MELYISEKIRRYRRERDMTQDQLAQALGVSPQSISKWECGDGYPDITLLPGIANFFEITVDELIGNDESSAKEDIQKNYFDALDKMAENNEPDEKRLELGLKYHRKYPRNWKIATALMQEIACNNRDRLDEYRHLMNEMSERILKECSDSVRRRSAIEYMCMICDENEIEAWLERDTQCWRDENLDVYEDRYQLTGDTDKYWMYRYAGNFNRASYAVLRLCIHPSIGKTEESVKWRENYIRVIDGFTARRTDEDIPDGWIGEYGLEYTRLSAAYFGLGDREKGYEYLDKAMLLNERWADIPDKAPLDLGNPILFGETKILKNGWKLHLPDGKEFPYLNGVSCSMFVSIYDILTAEHGWEWFNPVRGEPRFKEYLNRAKTMAEE